MDVPPVTPPPLAVSRAGLSAAGFTPALGARYAATVVDVVSPTTVMLQVGGQRLAAETQVRLERGQVLALHVIAVGDRVHLRVVAPQAAMGDEALALGVLQQALGGAGSQATHGSALARLVSWLAESGALDAGAAPSTISRAVARLGPLLDRLAADTPTAQLTALLRARVESGGVFLERSLRAAAERHEGGGVAGLPPEAARDVRMQLAAAAAALDAEAIGGNEAAREPAALVRRALEDAGQQQVLSALRWVRDGVLRMTVPLNVAGEVDELVLEIHESRAARQGRRRRATARRVDVQLALGSLGAVHVSARWLGRTISTTVSVERTEVRAWAEAERPAFERALAGLGFREIEVAVAAGLPATPARPPAILPGGSILDVRA